MSNHNSATREYFKGKAAEYDDVDGQLYWVLSDNFYKEILKRELPRFLQNKDIRLLDAGAGTGRWTLFFSELFGAEYDIRGTLVDLSPEMLDEARRKIESQGLSQKFECSEANIESLSEFKDSHYDVSLSFYNVLSFVENPSKALAEIARKLRPGGIHVSVVANTYHAYYFNILTDRLSELERTEHDSTVRFNSQMPPIHCFTPHELEALYLSSGFKNVEIMGGPNFIYPGMEETFVHGQTESLKKKLSGQEALNSILALELKHYKDQGIASRANTLLAIAQK